MKVALIGAGKTGGHVKDVIDCTVFDENNKPTVEKIKEHDVVISFLPGEPFAEYIDMLVESKVPVATGSTGFEWPDGIHEQLLENNVAWITSSNFSLGMVLVQRMLEQMKHVDTLFENPDIVIRETHHKNKKDKPSGTALSWREWTGIDDIRITSSRIGDVVGEHSISLRTESEEIYLKHTANNRGLFARGAVWAAQRLHEGNVPAGLNQFKDVVAQLLEQDNG